MEIRPNTKVKAVTSREIELTDGTRIAVLPWSGQRAPSSHPLIDQLNFPKEHNRLKVNVSIDSVGSQQKFVTIHGLPFLLLSVPDLEIVKSYNMWAKKSTSWKRYMDTDRTTYLIGPDQKIKAILKKVKPAENVTLLCKVLAS